MRAKIYERNPDTEQIRWRYVDESHDKFGWPNYGRILKQKTETWIEGYRKWKKKIRYTKKRNK